MDGLAGGLCAPVRQAALSGHSWVTPLKNVTLKGEKQEVNLHQKKGNGFWLH